MRKLFALTLLILGAFVLLGHHEHGNLHPDDRRADGGGLCGFLHEQLGDGQRRLYRD